MRRRAMVVLCGLMLAACQQKDAEAPPAAPEPAPIPTPARKAGLWLQKVESEGRTQTVLLCLDAAADKVVPLTGVQAAGGACKETVLEHAGQDWRFEALCNMGTAGTTTTTGTVSGDFSSHYVVQAKAVTENASAPQMNGTRDLTIDSTWHAPCPATMKPGDVNLPGGFTVNLLGLDGR